MIIYQVTVAIDPAVEEEWFAWMKNVHIPDVLRTGCFTASRAMRSVDNESSERVYVFEYEADSLEHYHRYRDNFALALQKDHSDRFAGRFRASRQILEQLADLRG